MPILHRREEAPEEKIPALTEKPLEFRPVDPVWDLAKEWILEIGPGKGEFLLWLAPQSPQKLFIAVEIKKRRFLKISEKAESQGLENIILVKGDARVCLPQLFQKECLREVYVLFPDPWPKRRHHKHRLLNRERTDEIHRFLKPGGKAWVATDDPHYATQIQSVFPKEKWTYEPGRSLYPTYFEKKWKNLGRSIHYFCFGKTKGV